MTADWPSLRRASTYLRGSGKVRTVLFTPSERPQPAHLFRDRLYDLHHQQEKNHGCDRLSSRLPPGFLAYIFRPRTSIPGVPCQQQIYYTPSVSLFNDASVVTVAALEIVRGSLGAKQCLLSAQLPTAHAVVCRCR